MKVFLKNNISYLLCLLLLLTIGLYICTYFDKGAAILFFSENRTDFFNYFFCFTNSWGEGYAFLIIGLALLFYKIRNSITVGFTGLFTLVISRLLKDFFGHPRPSIYFSKILEIPNAIIPIPGVELTSSYTSSFPSGHTMAAFALYGLLAFSFKRTAIKILFLIIASLAGISRVYLGQHFLSDVVAGAFCGTLIALAMFALQEWMGRTPLKNRSLLKIK